MKKSQKQFVKKMLLETGMVSRNGCLQNRITRLGAIICDLKKDGYDIEGGYEKTEHGKDFVYRIHPDQMKKKQVVEYLSNGSVRIHYL